MAKRRGQIGTQFNWIFVLIAGALILAFFIMIINRQREVSEKKLATELLADLDMIITGQAVSPGSSKSLDLADLELSFTCEDYSVFNVAKTSGNSIIFSPSRMKGANMIAWTLEWDMPYRVANFIYLTIPEVKYYLIDPAQSSGKDSYGIKSDFPDTVDIEAVSATPDSFENAQRIRLVYFAKPMSSELPLPSTGLKDFRDDDVSVLYIENALGPEDFNGKAVMHFYRKKGDFIVEEGLFYSMGKETVYAAMFSDSYEIYMCNMQKVLKKLVIVTAIYQKRVVDILNGLSPGSPCSPYYVDSPFQSIIESVTDVDSQGNLRIHLGDLFSAVSYIQNLNDKTIFASCPEIY